MNGVALSQEIYLFERGALFKRECRFDRLQGVGWGLQAVPMPAKDIEFRPGNDGTSAPWIVCASNANNYNISCILPCHTWAGIWGGVKWTAVSTVWNSRKNGTGVQGWDRQSQILERLRQRRCHWGVDSTTIQVPPSLVKSARHWEVDQGQNSKKTRLRVHFVASLAPAAKAKEEPITMSDLLNFNRA
jgi:hypothetical protein